MRLCGFGARVMAVGADSFSRESMDGAGEPPSFFCLKQVALGF
jgi:hypothetical protein